MRDDMLNALWLNTFVTLCDEGHFTRAAQRLNMTQPGVSQHLRKLEQQIGQPLISRDGKRFVPTPAGEAVLALGRRRHRDEADLHQSLQSDAADAGKITLACSGSVALLLYPHLIAQMQTAPKLHIHVEAAPQTRIIDGVLGGSFSLGLTDHCPENPRISATKIGQDALCLVLPKSAGPNPDFAALQALGFIDHPDGAAYADTLLALNFPADYKGVAGLHIRSYINQIGQIPTPVAAGIGYTILPRSGINAYAASDQLQIIALDTAMEHDLWLIYRKARILAARELRLNQVLGAVLQP
jgi:DNA-binding transcriptional LysR family regulator